VHFDFPVYTSLQYEMTDIYAAHHRLEKSSYYRRIKASGSRPREFGSAHPFRFPWHLINKISPVHFSLGYRL
jgi:hypothetical protein